MCAKLKICEVNKIKVVLISFVCIALDKLIYSVTSVCLDDV